MKLTLWDLILLEAALRAFIKANMVNKPDGEALLRKLGAMS